MTIRIGVGPNVAARVAAGLALITTTSVPVLLGAREARSPAEPQAAGPGATFEVASIRVNRDLSDRPTLLRPILQQGGRVLMTRQTVRGLIQAAYRVGDNELIGGPDWAGSTGFDLEARGPADMSADTARAMLRTLLAERFALEVHREPRQVPIYVMTVTARNGQPGPQLRPAGAQCAPPTMPAGMPPPRPSPPRGIAESVSLLDRAALRCQAIFMPGHFSARSASMDALAAELSQAAGRPVVNRTGLTGEFDIDLRYAPDLNVAPEPRASDSPGLATALQEQLGLRLEGGRGPVEMLVIDRVRMPTDN